MGHFMNDGPIVWRFGKWYPVRRWWLRILRDQVFVPLWMISAVLAIPPGALAIRRRLAPRPGQCRKCGYSRAGLPTDAVCPECGAIPCPESRRGSRAWP
jgi:hypothetical protein